MLWREQRSHLQSLLMKMKLDSLCPEANVRTKNTLLVYHTILLRTGRGSGWTLRRRPGETHVAPYHPLLLEALNQRVDVRISLTSEHLQEDRTNYQAEVEGITASHAWKEISVLEFLHGLSSVNCEQLSSQGTVSLIVSQDRERRFRDSTERDEEIDDIYVNRKNESYIIINGDLRKLYAIRPPAIERMTLAQFALSYYKINSRQQNIYVDPQTNVGEDSREPIVGGERSAPQSLMLFNRIIMKRRSEKPRPVLLLLPSSEIGDFGNRMLFQPWRDLADLVQDTSQEEKELQKRNCLALLPTSIYPSREL